MSSYSTEENTNAKVSQLSAPAKEEGSQEGRQYEIDSADEETSETYGYVQC